MLTHDQLREKAFENPEVKARFEELKDAFAQLDEVLRSRAVAAPRAQSERRVTCADGYGEA